MAITKEDILEAVGSMTVMDLNDLVKAFEEKFGVSAAAVAVAAAPAAGAAATIVAAADTPNFSSRAFTSSESSRTDISSIAFNRSSLFIFAILCRHPLSFLLFNCF